MYNVDSVVLSFFIYCVLGWICEVIYCSVPKRKFINRGFLFGPYLPIYGFGAMTVILLLEPVFDYWWAVFLLGMLITSAMEYVTSFALEKLFKVKLWDYSNMKFNINGRVCLLNSTLFGLLCLFIVYVVNKPIYGFLSGLGDTLVDVLALVVVAVMSADCAVSVNKMAAFRKAVEDLSRAKAEAEARLKEATAFLTPEGLAEARQRLNKELEIRRDRYYGNLKRVFHSNPGLTARSGAELREQLSQARAMIEQMSVERRTERRIRREEKRARREEAKKK